MLLLTLDNYKNTESPSNHYKIKMYFIKYFRIVLPKEMLFSMLLLTGWHMFFLQWPFISLPILGHIVTNHTADFQVVSHISLGNYHLY